MVTSGHTRNFHKQELPAIYHEKTKTIDSEQIEIPTEELDEFAPNEVILLKS